MVAENGLARERLLWERLWEKETGASATVVQCHSLISHPMPMITIPQPGSHQAFGNITIEASTANIIQHVEIPNSHG